MKNPNNTNPKVKVNGETGYANQQAELAAKLNDEFSEFEAYALPTKGKHTVRLVSREKVAEKTDPHDDTKVVAQKYIALSWQDTQTGEVIPARLYSAAVPYFANNLNRQCGGSLMGMKLSQILDYVLTHAIDIWVDWSPDYGPQVTYFER